MGTKQGQLGFTLMEIMVATVVFAILFSALLGLFNYVLKVNRRTEAIRQAAQGARDFVEFLAKEIRNGQIDYYVSSGSYTASISNNSPCVPAGAVGAIASSTAPTTYALKDNKLGIINTDNVQECFYYAKPDGSYIDTVGGLPQTFASSTQGTLALQKTGVSGAQILNPQNFRIDQLMFIIRPLCDPYTFSPCTAYVGFPKIQPMVTILIQFTTQLPTGEKVTLYYQTTVSSYKYDIPH